MKNKTKINLILIIYNLLWYILLPLVLLIYLFRLILKKEDIKRFYERFGYIKKEQLNKKVIWLHAVSLGETMAAINLATELKKSFPKFSIVISTNTITSANYIIKKSKFIHCYQPLDHPLFVKNFLCFWNPYYAIFLESDYWPNLILGTQNRGIPIFFSSAQISKKAFNRWSKIPSLSKLIFNSPKLIFCIDKDQRSNFLKLRKKKIDKNIKIIGSLKISKNKLNCDKYFLSKLKSWSKNYKIILAASIHDIEDQIILTLHLNLQDKGYKYKLIIAPRHPELAKKLEKSFSNAKRKSFNQYPDFDDNVYICDTLGEMGCLYSVSDIIILGGSFIQVGGHNPLEPAHYGKIIITGKSKEKNAFEFYNLKRIGLVKEALNYQDLEGKVSYFLKNTIKKTTSLNGINYAKNSYNRNIITSQEIKKYLDQNDY